MNTNMNLNIFDYFKTMRPALSDPLFTVEDGTALKNGQQVEKPATYKKDYNDIFFSIPSSDYEVRFVYKLPASYYVPTLRYGNSADFYGFLFGGYVYHGEEAIKKAFRRDLIAKYTAMVPDEETAAKLMKKYKYESWELNDLNYTLSNAGVDEMVERHFYKGTRPEFSPLTDTDTIKDSSLIDYIKDPGKTVEKYANDCLSAALPRIRAQYHKVNAINAGLQEIEQDSGRIEHKIKAMAATITDEKTVNLTLTNGETVKVNASAIEYLGFRSNISSWDVAAADRGKLAKNEYNRPEDITPEMITRITYGHKVLFAA